jgi:hypothetical protein
VVLAKAVAQDGLRSVDIAAVAFQQGPDAGCPVALRLRSQFSFSAS